MTLEEIKAKGFAPVPGEPEAEGEDAELVFNTPSGKIEIASSALAGQASSIRCPSGRSRPRRPTGSSTC